ncbi:MAG: ABC transporter substrate-binding protein [Xanthobacteraceae bacterium]
MSSSNNDNETRSGRLAYAPKWARQLGAPDLDRLGSPSIADTEFPQHNDQSLPTEDFVDQPRDDRSLNSRLEEVQRARSARSQGREGVRFKDREQPLSERDLLRRSLEPEVIRDTWPSRERQWRPATLVAFAVIMASIGAAILLFVADGLPYQWSKMPRFSNEFMARFSGNPARTAETQASPAGMAPAVTPTPTRSTGNDAQRIASLPAANGQGGTVHGVTNSEIVFGMAAPFTGSAKELGHQMKLGIETAFNLANDAGGINGRQVKLTAADDGYEPTRTAGAMTQLYEKQKVFGFVGNVGTPTAVVALPYALEHRTLFFGAFTGADLLRRDPPDRYVFNYRASYAEETNAVVRYLVNVRRLRPEQIAVFAQHDAYGDAGFAGVAKAIRALQGDDSSILRVGYERNTVDVDDAVSDLGGHKPAIKAVVMVAAYRAAARFIAKTRDLFPSMIFSNVSFVGSTALADELMLLGPRYANGVIVTQVVPAVDGYASVILKYRTALAKYSPGEPTDYVSMEGYVDAEILLEALKRAGPQLDTESLVDSLERLRGFDMGLGTLISFSPSEHQGSHKVWGTQLDERGHYVPVDLE